MKPDKNEDAGLMPPISGIVLIMKLTHATSITDLDYKGIGETGFTFSCDYLWIYRYKMLILYRKFFISVRNEENHQSYTHAISTP